jgi:transposase
MSKKRQSPYSDEFKKEALHMLATSGKTKADIERELGLSHGLLGKWKKRFQVNDETDALELNEVTQLQAEVRRLQRENARLKDDFEILKKTIQIFSTDQRR